MIRDIVIEVYNFDGSPLGFVHPNMARLYAPEDGPFIPILWASGWSEDHYPEFRDLMELDIFDRTRIPESGLRSQMGDDVPLRVYAETLRTLRYAGYDYLASDAVVLDHRSLRGGERRPRWSQAIVEAPGGSGQWFDLTEIGETVSGDDVVGYAPILHPHWHHGYAQAGVLARWAVKAHDPMSQEELGWEDVRQTVRLVGDDYPHCGLLVPAGLLDSAVDADGDHVEFVELTYHEVGNHWNISGTGHRVRVWAPVLDTLTDYNDDYILSDEAVELHDDSDHSGYIHPEDACYVDLGGSSYAYHSDDDAVVRLEDGDWNLRSESSYVDGQGWYADDDVSYCDRCYSNYVSAQQWSCCPDDADEDEDEDEDEDRYHFTTHVTPYRESEPACLQYHRLEQATWPYTIGFEVEKNSVNGADSQHEEHHCDCGPDLFWSYWTTDGSCGVEGVTNPFGLFPDPTRPWVKRPEMQDLVSRYRELVATHRANIRDIMADERQALTQPADHRCGGHLTVNGPADIWTMENIRKYAGLYYALYRKRIHNVTGSSFVNKNKALDSNVNEKYSPIRKRSLGSYEFRLPARVLNDAQLWHRYEFMALWANAVTEELSFAGYLRVNAELLRRIYPNPEKRNMIRGLALKFQQYLNTSDVHPDIAEFI